MTKFLTRPVRIVSILVIGLVAGFAARPTHTVDFGEVHEVSLPSKAVQDPQYRGDHWLFTTVNTRSDGLLGPLLASVATRSTEPDPWQVFSRETSWRIAWKLAVNPSAPDVAVIEELDPDGPAFDAGLEVGDAIVSIEGKPVSYGIEMRQAVKDSTGPVRVVVDHAGQRREILIEPRRGQPGNVLGVSAAAAGDAPLAIRPDFDGSAGGSGGLIHALAYLDASGPGALGNGHVIAGTGGLDVDGTVIAVMGVEHKARAAAAAGVSVFFVPEANCQEAMAGATGTAMAIVPVGSFADAVAWLAAGR